MQAFGKPAAAPHRLPTEGFRTCTRDARGFAAPQTPLTVKCIVESSTRLEDTLPRCSALEPPADKIEYPVWANSATSPVPGDLRQSRPRL
jgi:hypothetical protein